MYSQAKIWIFFFCTLCIQLGWAQDAPPDTSKVEQIIVDHSDIGEYITEGDRQIQLLMKSERQVELRQGDTYMYCDTAIIEKNDVVAYGNVIIQQGDSLNVFADSLVFIGDAKVADFFGDVVLETGEQKLFTQELNYNLNTKLATYYSGAMLTNEQTQLTSKRGYYYVDQEEAFFKDSVVVIDEEFNLQADTLQFNTNTKVATFLGPTLIQQDSAKIYCEAGFYDTANKRAEFTQNAQYVKGEQQATAKKIRYEGDVEQVILEGEAQFVEGTKIANADVIRYDDVNELTFLEGNAIYQDEDQYIESDKIQYDTQNESVKTQGRSKILDDAQILIADEIDYDNASEIGIAQGNVYWIDTVEQITIQCENAFYDKNEDYLKATGGRPLMTTLIDGDTLYLAADTLISFRPEEQPDTTLTLLDSVALDSLQQIQLDSTLLVTPNGISSDSIDLAIDSVSVSSDSIAQGKNEDARSLTAIRNVMIYKSNMQAVCDSLTYNTADSLFQFYEDPIIWSDTSQFYADVIHMQLANEKLDKILLYNNSFVINSADEIFFNQIKGRDIIAYFIDDEIRRVKVDGNAESVYYALDEVQAYVAVNKTVCSEMMLFFGNNEIERINFFKKPTATMYPMRDADHEALELPGFFWETKSRPTSVEYLLQPSIVVEEIEKLSEDDKSESDAEGGSEAGQGIESPEEKIEKKENTETE